MDELEAYLTALCEAARRTLGEDLLGIATTGSVALDAFVPGRSDVDLVVVAEDATRSSRCRSFADAMAQQVCCRAVGRLAIDNGAALDVVERAQSREIA